jgi:pyruvate-ferredoxin/flavodoxin oxidoreductase
LENDEKEREVEIMSEEKKRVKFPGIPTTTDGAGAVVWVESQISQGACAYPITPSTTMGTGYQLTVANGQKNLWGESLSFIEPESEHSSASTCEGFALAGGRVTNFTSGQGLVLMKEVLYTISGKRLPVVFHIAARALTSHSLNIHAGHDDVMAVSDTGWGILFGRNAQEACDLALICRRTAEVSFTPFLNVMDGFLTSHTTENVLLPEAEFMAEYVGNPNENLINLMDPHHPLMSGTVQNQDSYMKGKIAQRYYYDGMINKLKESMTIFYELTGRFYDVVVPYRLEDAQYAIIGMGTMMETAEIAVDFLREKQGIKVGVLHVTSFRPFPGIEIVEALKNVEAISIVERVDNPMAQSNPLAMEIKSAFSDSLAGHPGYPSIDKVPKFYSGSAGLGSRDVRPGDFIAVVKNMQSNNDGRYFALGIKHSLALERESDPETRLNGEFSMRGHSVGGYGSVTTNKVIATIVEDLFNLYVQAYPKYGSEKKGLPTTYYLTVAEEKIRNHCELEQVDFVPVNDVNAFSFGNPLAGIRDSGMIFIQSEKTDYQEIWNGIPRHSREMIVERNIHVYVLDAIKIAREVSSSPDLIQRMQGIVLLGIFLRVTPFRSRRRISEKELFEGVERSIRKYFGKRGEQVVQDNLVAVRRGYEEVSEIPRSVMIKGEEVSIERSEV